MSSQSQVPKSLPPLVEADVLAKVLAKGRSTGAEFAEIYIEDKRSTSAGLDDGKVEQVTSGRDRGAGIRVVSGETTGFAHTSDLSERGLLAAALAAAEAAKQGDGGVHKIALQPLLRHPVNTVRIAPDEVAKARKVEMLMRVDAAARSVDGSVVQVSAGYGDSMKRILIANSDGVFSADDQVRTLFRVSVVASGDAGMQTGYDSLGHTIGFELFEEHDVEELAVRAAKQAITKLKARPAPSGSMPVVIKRGSGGVLFHEACGHGLEADLVGKGASVYRGKVGQSVAAPFVTLVDDGTMTGEWGAIGIDDEGANSDRVIDRDLKDFRPRLHGAFRPVGDTDSEHAFCWLMQELAKAHAAVPPVEELSRTLSELCLAPASHGTFNFLLSNGQALWAHASTQLHWLERSHPFGAARLKDEDLSVDFGALTQPGDRVALVATEPLTTDEPWTAFAPGELRIFRDGLSRPAVAV